MTENGHNAQADFVELDIAADRARREAETELRVLAVAFLNAFDTFTAGPQPYTTTTTLAAAGAFRAGIELVDELDPLIEGAHVLGILTAQSNSKAPKTRPPFDFGA